MKKKKKERKKKKRYALHNEKHSEPLLPKLVRND